MKIWPPANSSSNIFRLIQHSFHFGSVYSLFHPTFYSYAIISNIRTSNLAKNLSVNASYSSDNTGRWPPCISCGEITSSICFKTVSKSSTLIQNISLNTYRYSTMSSFIMLRKEPNWCLRLTYLCVLHRGGFSSSESTSSDSITGKSMSFATFDLTSNERMNVACWMKHVGWHVQTIQTFIQHSSNIYPTFHWTYWIKCWIGLTTPLNNKLQDPTNY